VYGFILLLKRTKLMKTIHTHHNFFCWMPSCNKKVVTIHIMSLMVF